MARRRAFRSSADGRQGAPCALRKPLFRDGRIANVDQLATTRRDSCRLDKGDWSILVTRCRTTNESEFSRREAVLLVHQAAHLARFQALFTRSSRDTTEPGGTDSIQMQSGLNCLPLIDIKRQKVVFAADSHRPDRLP